MDWVKLALLGFQIVQWFLDRAKAADQFDAGKQHEVARAAMELLRQTELGKQYADRVEALDDAGLTDLEKQLTGGSGTPAPDAGH